jgi:hypothetical protein
MGEEFVRFTMTIPSHWEHSLSFSARRTGILIFVFAPFLLLMAYLHARDAISWSRKQISPLVWMLGALFSSAAFTMTALDSSNNHYIPFLALACAAAGAGTQRLLTRSASKTFLMSLGLAGLPMWFAEGVFARPDVPDFARYTGIWVLALLVVLCLFRIGESRRSLGIAAVLLAGQSAVASYNPLLYVPETGYENDLATLRAELAKLDGPVIWANFGNVPKAFFAFKPNRAPSWVAVSDIARQVGEKEAADPDLTPFRERIKNTRGTYILADQALENIPGWEFASRYAVLVKDYGPAFSRLKKVAYPWYGNDRYPQYLYKLDGPGTATRGSSVK